MGDRTDRQAVTAVLAEIVVDFDAQIRASMGRHCPPVGTTIPVVTEFARALFERTFKDIDILWFLGEAPSEKEQGLEG